MAEQVNYYMELELDRNLSNEELGKQLKAIIRKWRSRTTAPDQEVRHKAEKMMEIAEEAMAILTDSIKRALYDKELTEQIKKQTEILEKKKPELSPKENTQDKYNRIYENTTHFEELGDLNEAMILARKLIDINPNDWRGWEIIGRLHHNSDWQLAQNYYQKAIDIGENIPTYVYYNLGLVQKNSGKYVDAFISFQNSLDISPSYDFSLQECNELLEYINIDSILPFLKNLTEKRNDSLAYETLAKAYSIKAESLVQELEGSPVFTSKEQIQEYIELMEEAKSYSDNQEINHKIVKAKHALGKKFDKSKIPVLIFPLFMGGTFSLSDKFSLLLSVIVLAVIIDSSIRPRFEINRWKMERKGTLYDKVVDKMNVKGSLKWTIAVWFIIIVLLAPITAYLYLGLVIYLIFTKFFPQVLSEKAFKIGNERKKGNQ